MPILLAIRATLVALVAVTGPQRAGTSVGPAAWVEALKTRSSAPSTVPDAGDFGTRGGTVDPDEESRLLEPFDSPTTEEARIAVPLLLALLEDETTVFGSFESVYERRDRAWEALVRISFRRIGRFTERNGCYSPEMEDGRAAKRDGETREGWRRWWRENAAKELGVWRHEAIEEKFASIVRFDERPDAAEGALEDIALLGRTCRTYLTTQDEQTLSAIAGDTGAPPMVRSRAVGARIALDEIDAFPGAERFVLEDGRSFEARRDVIHALETAGARGRPSLIALARQFAVSAGEPPQESAQLLFCCAIGAVERQTRPRTRWLQFAPQSIKERLEIVRKMEAWWADLDSKTR